MNKEAEVVNLPLICRNYPNAIQNEICRDYLLDTIDTMFEGISVVVLDGEDGAGKTTLLAQYSKRYPNQAISCFINPYSKIGYSPEYIRLIIGEQMNWIITKKYERLDSFDSSTYNKSLLKLERMAINSQRKYFFVIDGIDDIPEDDKAYGSVILREMLPIGQPWAKILFTGSSTSRYSHIDGIYTPWKVPPFGEPEVREYFSELRLSMEQLDDIRRMCRRIPGHLSCVRRLLIAGKSVEDIIASDPKAVLDFIKLEFKTMGTLSNRMSRILSILAFSFSRFSPRDISMLLGEQTTEVESDIDGCAILQKEPTSNVVSFISNPHREFARKNFADKKQWVIDTIIEHLKSHEDDINQLTELPAYLKYANRYDELLNQLTHDHLAKLVMKTETVSPLIDQIDLGLDASISLNRYLSEFNYAMLKSLSLELCGIETSEVEIEARLATNDLNSAVALANNAVLKEDRLRLLSFIAKYNLEHGLQINESFKAQISMLAKQIDFSTPGSNASLIASNLIWMDPDLAISILEKGTEKRDDRDLAFAKLTIRAQTSGPFEQDTTDHLLKKTVSKIQNPEIQDFISRARILLGKSEPSAVVELLKGSEFRTKMLCLRSWARAVGFCKNPEVVLTYALDEMVKNTAYRPKIKDLCDFAKQLPNIEDLTEAKRLVNRFDSMIASVEQYGCSQDNTNAQILLSKAEKKYDETACTNRVIDLYLGTSKITDLADKVECLAIIRVALPELDSSGIIEKKEHLQSSIDEELKKSVSELINGSANHYEVIKATIGILSLHYPYVAMEIIESINTHSRRNQAYFDLSIGMLENPIASVDFTLLQMIIKEYVDEETGWNILVKLFARAFRDRFEIQSDQLIALKPFVVMLDSIHEADQRCNAACLAYSLYKFSAKAEFSEITDELEKMVNESFASIEPAWEKIEAGNRIVINFANSELEKAQKYLSTLTDFSNSVNIEGLRSVNIYIAILRLAIRSYPELFSDAEEFREQFGLIEHLIGLLPCTAEQIILWANLAMLGYARGRKIVADRLVKTYIWPSLDHFPPLEEKYKAETINRIAPALYYYNKSTAFEIIGKLLKGYQDKTLYQICDFIFTKTLWLEPIESKSHQGFDIIYTEASDICEILEHINNDGIIYSTVENLVESIVSRSGKVNFNDVQKSTIKDRLKALIQSKLPDKDNIKHEGYKIIAEAQLMRLDKRNQEEWKTLLQRASAIPNTSDRAYIFPILARCIPNNLPELKTDCIKKAIESAANIPTYLDRIDRYVTMSEEIQSFDEPSARTVLKIAMKVSALAEDPESVYPKQKQIIDRANRLSPEFAEEVADLFDCDPARMKARIDSLLEEPAKIIARFDLHAYLKMLKAKNNKNVKAKQEKTELKDDQQVEIAWDRLGALNAGLENPLRLEDAHEQLLVASRLPLTRAYPIYMWFIANLTQRLAPGQTISVIKPIFESLVALANFTLTLHSKDKAQIKRLQEDYRSENKDLESIIVSSDDQSKAMEYIRKWLSENLGDCLYICDPYFNKDALEYIKIVGSIKQDCQIYIVTGNTNENLTEPSTQAEYRLAWRQISNEDPPPTNVIVATLVSGKPAFHDRFWLTPGKGLSFGTSLNGIGSPRISNISVMQRKEYEKCNSEILPFIERRRNCNGTIVRYFLFSLSD